jgi:hypothetical protein
MWVRKSRPLGGVEINEIAELFRQVGALRHLGAVDQHRNDRRLAFESGLDLHSDRVGLLVHARGAVGALAEPVRADHGDQHVGPLQGLLDVGAKIDAERDVIDVHEHRLLAVLRGEAIEDPPGDRRAVGAAVGDQDRRHRS